MTNRVNIANPVLTAPVVGTDWGLPVYLAGNAGALATEDVSDGTPGSTAPLTALQIGGVDPDGDLRAVAVTTSGQLILSGTISGGNAAAGVTGTTVPGSADYLGINVGGNLVGISSSNPLPITGSISATNPSVGTTGSTTPTSATLLGASDGTNLQPLLVESSSHQNLRVSIYNGSTEIGVTSSSLNAYITNSSLAVTGTFWQATQPVSLASLPALASGSNTIGAVTQASGPWTINLTQLDGSALGAPSNYGTSPGAVAVAGVNAYITNTPAVSQSGTWTVGSSSATGSAVPANSFYNGWIATTSYPTAATNGNLVGGMADKAGRQTVVLNTVRDLIGTASYQSTSGTLASFIAAGAAGVYNDICELVLTNEGSGATIVSLSDGTTTYKFALAGNGGLTKTFATPLVATSTATAWQVSNSAANNVDCIAVYAKNK